MLAGGEPGLEQLSSIVGVQGVQPAQLAVLVPRLPGVLLPCRLRLDEAAARVRGPDDGGRGHDEGPVAFLPTGHLLRCAQALGDVPLDGRHAHDRARRVPDRRHGQ